ncbi:MAG: YkvA family protein [Nitriliruptor sp.]
MPGSSGARQDGASTSTDRGHVDGTGAELPAGPRPYWREVVGLLPDLGRLLRSLSRDPRVPWHAKIVAGAAALYVASPVDLLPDVVPGVGGVDDLVAVLIAVRRLVTAAGYDVVREHWTGSDDGFGALIVLAGVGTARRPLAAAEGEDDR